MKLLAGKPGWTVEADVIVIGSGVAGLTTALNLRSSDLSVLLVTKAKIDEGSTKWAQGGIAAALGPGDTPDQHKKDTLIAGAGLCDNEAVNVLVTEGPEAVRKLIARGAVFDKSESGEISLTREGGHVLKSDSGSVCGVTLHVIGAGSRDGVGRALARAVVIATGGLGQVYAQTTNPSVSTGDGVALALRAGAEIADVEFIQFHPTVLWRDDSLSGQQPLISEAVRGEGAVLVNDKGVRFMKDKHPQGDLAPRDIVAIEIFKQMKETNSPHVWLDTTKIKDFAERFPTIFASCIENGIDPRKQMIPVSPASHYSSGGVRVDLAGRTSIPGLYACGETACTGAHGANRLASNSLLEGLVFGTRISADIAANIAQQGKPSEKSSPEFLLDPAIKMTLQLAMSQGAGVMRSAQSLSETLATLQQLASHTSNQPCIEAWEVSNLYLLATAIARAALEREETRGSHWRSDFPESKENWIKRIVQSYDSNGNWLSKFAGVNK